MGRAKLRYDSKNYPPPYNQEVFYPSMIRVNSQKNGYDKNMRHVQCYIRENIYLVFTNKSFLGYGNSIDKLGYDIINNIANLPPISVFGFLLMAISVGGLALLVAGNLFY